MQEDQHLEDVPEYVLALEDSRGSRERIACPICESERQSAVYEGVALRGNNVVLVMCRDCSHLFLTPRPTMEIFKRFYADEDYFHLCANFSDVTLGEKMGQFGQDDFWDERFSHGKRLYDHYLAGQLGKDDIVFDFGCGDGAWLGGLRQASGCQIDGEEISPIYADIIKKKLGVSIFLGAVEEVAEDIAEKYRGKVKLAIVSGSLQHMLDPMKCLRVARDILTDDGRLYICNWSIFEHYMKSFDGSFRRLAGEIVSWEHLHYFHETSFRYMLAKAGFRVEEFALNSEVRVRHMDAFASKSGEPAQLPSPEEVAAVLERIRAMESATIADRLRMR